MDAGMIWDQEPTCEPGGERSVASVPGPKSRIVKTKQGGKVYRADLPLDATQINVKHHNDMPPVVSYNTPDNEHWTPMRLA